MTARLSNIWSKKRAACGLPDGYLLAITLNTLGIGIILAAILVLIVRAQISLP